MNECDAMSTVSKTVSIEGTSTQLGSPLSNVYLRNLSRSSIIKSN